MSSSLGYTETLSQEIRFGLELRNSLVRILPAHKPEGWSLNSLHTCKKPVCLSPVTSVLGRGRRLPGEDQLSNQSGRVSEFQVQEETLSQKKKKKSY